jgi:hypothetical protein
MRLRVKMGNNMILLCLDASDTKLGWIGLPPVRARQR